MFWVKFDATLAMLAPAISNKFPWPLRVRNSGILVYPKTNFDTLALIYCKGKDTVLLLLVSKTNIKRFFQENGVLSKHPLLLFYRFRIGRIVAEIFICCLHIGV